MWAVSVPLRGVGCFVQQTNKAVGCKVSVPLRGVGCFYYALMVSASDRRFPSPCGVWVVSRYHTLPEPFPRFPSPCGVWVVSWLMVMMVTALVVSVPLRGVGCFRDFAKRPTEDDRFRPLAGCGLFPLDDATHQGPVGFRPLAGCGLFPGRPAIIVSNDKFPSPCGVWVVSIISAGLEGLQKVSVPLRGVGCFNGMDS